MVACAYPSFMTLYPDRHMPTLYQNALKRHKHTVDQTTLRRIALRSVFDRLESSLRAKHVKPELLSFARWHYLAEAHGVSLHTVHSWIRNLGMPLSAAILFESKYGALRCNAQELLVPPPKENT